MSYSELSAALVRECAAWKERCERAEQEVARLKEELAMDPGYVAAAREEQARADSLAQEVASLKRDDEAKELVIDKLGAKIIRLEQEVASLRARC